MNYVTGLSFSEADLLKSIPERFRQVLAYLPSDQLAYVDAEERLTYQELAAASRTLAAALIGKVGNAASRAEQKAVALLLPSSSAALIGIYGVLEAGHFYVPLDFVLGEDMLRQILLDCPPQAIVTTTILQARLRSILPDGQIPPAVLCIDALPSDQAPVLPCWPGDTQMYASVFYTSGSTGKPRGVIRTHALNLYASYLAHYDFGFAPGGRVYKLRSYVHASSTQPIFGSLLNGATLHSVPDAEDTPAKLYRWILEKEITHLYVSHGLQRGLAEFAETHHPPQPLRSLRVIITGGEALQRSDVERLKRLLPPTCKFVARLVSTEATVYARFVIEAGTSWSGDQVPAGYTPPGCQVMILDENLQPAAADQIGEIAVRSRFLAGAGYWNRPAETAARFLPDPEDHQQQIFLTGDLGRLTADGLLEHVGRKDFMVKIHGYRVQLEEVEAALAALPAVQEAAVVAQSLLSGEKRLVAYLVPQSVPGPSAEELRRALRDRLPDYMIPARFQMLTSLPLTASGKVDRKALPPPGKERPAMDAPLVAPRTEIETQLAAVWGEVVEIHPIGVQDDFFALGGDSVTLLKLAIRLQQQFGQEVPLTDFLHHSTIEKLAQFLIAGSTDS